MDNAKQVATSDNLRQRILEIKNKLPRRYTQLLVDANKKLKGKENQIRRVVGLQVVDEDITVALEKFVQTLA